MAWSTTSTETVYENRWISVREDQVVGPAGPGIYGVVELRQPAVFVVALDDDDRVCLVTVDRYTVGRSVEVPAGGTDGEEPLVAAQRELFEEAGVRADEWTLVGRIDALNGVTKAPEFVFLARGLTVDGDASSSQREEGIDAVEWVDFAEVLARIGRGEITDGETVAAMALAGIRLGRFA